MASPEEQANRFILEVWTLQGVAYLVVGLRYYHRIRTMGWQKLAWDDALMLLATLVYTAESVMGYLVVAYWNGLANNAMTAEQRAALDPASREYMQRVNGSKTHVVGMLLYNTVLWLLKGCWAVYYARLTDGVHRMNLMIKGAYAIIPLTYVACVLVSLLKCLPFHKQWQIHPAPGNSCEPAISTLQTVFVMVMNTLTDFYLMAIPLPIVWKSKLPPRKKLVLFIMFGGGFLEMAFGILRCTSILTLGNIDPALSGYWSIRESFVSFVLTNMPMVYPLVKRYYEKGLSSVASKGGGATTGDTSRSQGHRLGSVLQRKPNKGAHPLSLPGDTNCWASNENIVVVDERSEYAKTGDSSSAEELPIQGAKTVQVSAGLMGHHQRGMSNHLEDGNGIVVTREYTVIGHAK